MRDLILNFLTGVVVLVVLTGIIIGMATLESAYDVNVAGILCACVIAYVIGWAIRGQTQKSSRKDKRNERTTIP